MFLALETFNDNLEKGISHFLKEMRSQFLSQAGAMGAATAMEAVVEATADAVVVAAATAAADTGYDREMSDFSHSRSLIIKYSFQGGGY